MSRTKDVELLVVKVKDFSYTEQQATIEVTMKIRGAETRIIVPDVEVPVGGRLELKFGDNGFPIDFMPSKNQNN